MQKFETNTFSDKCSDILIPDNLSSDTKEKVYSYLTKANKLYHLFQYEHAFKLYEEIESITDQIGHVSYRLGVMYHDGHHVSPDAKKAEEYFGKALVLLSYCAEKGEAESLCDLGYMYYCGRGTRVDYNLALNYYKRASDQGHCRATNNLGHMYRDGHGTKTDLIKACELYQKAGEKGYDRAQSSLAFMYLKGYGVQGDQQQAILWYQLAAFQKYDRAIDSLKRIFHELSPELKAQYVLTAPKYLSEHWPALYIHNNLSPDCRAAIIELFVLFKHSHSFGGYCFPIELVFLLAKYIIKHWTYTYAYL